MNVRELIEALEDYGDHLEVKIVVTGVHGEEKTYAGIEVDTYNTGGEPHVVLAVED